MLEQLDTAIGFATVMLLLSLLVTAAVQMVVALAGLRGKCLLNGTEQLLKQLYPGLQDQARTIAEKVLRHPAVGVRDVIWNVLSEGNTEGNPGDNPEGTVAPGKARLAVAIRPKELILVLEDLADHDPDLKNIKETLKAPFTSTPRQGSAEMVAKAEELLKKMELSFPEETKNLRTSVESVLGTTQSIAVRVDAWFDTVMDRTSEVFKVYTRCITVGVAVVLALALRVDSLSILSQISQDADLRANLVQMSGSVVSEGEKVLAPDGSALATQALRKLAQDQAQPDVAQAVSSLCKPESQPCFANLSTRQEGRAALEPLSGAQKAGVLKAYEDAYTQAAQARLSSLGVSFNTLQDYLTDTKLAIVPDPLLPWGFKGGRNFLGVVMTAFFLSLGAPFWYHTLRRLSDLRPIVARRVEEDQAVPQKTS